MQSFPKIKLITVGKIKKGWLKEGIAIYSQRLPEIDVIEINDTGPRAEAAKAQSLLKRQDKLVVLSEEGQTFNSKEFSHWLSQDASGTLVFFIGGPTGVSPELKTRACQVFSLSPLTFPHDMARLLLLEQLYRAKTILQGGSYHK